MISIAMPQPVEAKFPGIRLIPNPMEFLQLGTGWGPRCWLSFPVGYTHNGVNSVFTKGTETCHQKGTLPGLITLGHSSEGPRGGSDQIKKKGVSSMAHKSRSPSRGHVVPDRAG